MADWSRAVITARTATCGSGGMIPTTDNSVTGGRIYHLYMQRSTAPSTGSRNWACGRTTGITVKVYQRQTEDGATATNTESAQKIGSHVTRCNRQVFTLLAM